MSYQLYFDGDRPITYPSVLYVRDTATIYQMKPGLREEWDGTQKSEVSHVSSSSPIDDGYIKMDHLAKSLLTFDILSSSSALVTDNYPEMTWVISDENKNVAGYDCVKATTTYRGRNWIAWFTPQIAVPYGPWKLHGLPGLILEVVSEDQKFIMKVLKIETIGSDLFTRDFTTFRKTYNKEPITYREFLVKSDEAFENMIKKMQSQGANVVGEKPPRNGLELKYEWEE